MSLGMGAAKWVFTKARGAIKDSNKKKRSPVKPYPPPPPTRYVAGAVLPSSTVAKDNKRARRTWHDNSSHKDYILPHRSDYVTEVGLQREPHFGSPEEFLDRHNMNLIISRTPIHRQIAMAKLLGGSPNTWGVHIDLLSMDVVVTSASGSKNYRFSKTELEDLPRTGVAKTPTAVIEHEEGISNQEMKKIRRDWKDRFDGP